MNTYKIRRINDNWEQLINPQGEVIAESHYLDVEDVLEGLGLEYESEEVEEDEDWKTDKMYNDSW